MTYSDQPYQPGSKPERIEITEQATQSTGTASSGQDPQCKGLDKVRAPEKMLEKAKEIQRGDIPEGEVCCRNGKVVECN